MVPSSMGYFFSSASSTERIDTVPGTSTDTSPLTWASARKCAGSSTRTIKGSWYAVSWKCFDLDRIHRRQVAHDGRPAVAGIRRAIDLAAGGPEIYAARVERIYGHRV